ncbi:MAG: hypothetical protein AB8G05_11295 [Oligoflexales bacterium]
MIKIYISLLLILFFSDKANGKFVCDKLANHYEYLDSQLIGSGQVGHVYKATRLEDGQLFVLKFSRIPSNYFINKSLRMELKYAQKWRELGLFPCGLVEWIEKEKVLIKPWIPGNTFAQHFENESLHEGMLKKFVKLFKVLVENRVLIKDLSPHNLVFDQVIQEWQIIDSKETLKYRNLVKLKKDWLEELELRYFKNYKYIRENPGRVEGLKEIVELVFKDSKEF